MYPNLGVYVTQFLLMGIAMGRGDNDGSEHTFVIMPPTKQKGLLETLAVTQGCCGPVEGRECLRLLL